MVNQYKLGNVIFTFDKKNDCYYPSRIIPSSEGYTEEVLIILGAIPFEENKIEIPVFIVAQDEKILEATGLMKDWMQQVTDAINELRAK